LETGPKSGEEQDQGVKTRDIVRRTGIRNPNTQHEYVTLALPCVSFNACVGSVFGGKMLEIRRRDY
jgi:hypothetical protein